MLAALRRQRDWIVLGALVGVSVILRTWASRGVPTPWITPDEPLYGLLGRGLYDSGRLTILGEPAPYYSLVVPAVAGLPLSLRNLTLGYSVLKAEQAVVMSLAAVPVYLWGRTLMARGWALGAAVLTLAVPGLAYSGLVMSEVVFYPVLVLATWALAAAIASPTGARQAVFIALLLLALATRIQAIVLVPAFLTAIVLDAVLARSRARLARNVPAVAALALLALAWIALRAARGGSVLAGYADAAGSYGIGDAARFVAYHAGDLALLSGVVPLCALLLLLLSALAHGESDPRARAFVATSVSVSFWLVLEVGTFASRHLGLLAERNLFAAAPLLFLGFALWLDRGGPGGLRARGLVAILVGAAVMAIPLTRFVVFDALPHAFTLIPLYRLRDHLGVTQLVLAVGLCALFVLLPRRFVPVLALLVFCLLAMASVLASQRITTETKAQQQRLLGPERRWVDAAADGPVAQIYDGQTYWNTVWETAFWNRRIRWVYDFPGTQVPGPLPQEQLAVQRDGELRPDGRVAPARYAVIPLGIALRGTQIAQAPQVGTDRLGLGLWRVDPPLRLSTITSGLLENGDVSGDAVLTAYDCRGGTFDAVLLVKEPQTVSVYLDGHLVARQAFPTATTWHPRVPVGAEAGESPCKLKIVSTGLLGTTRFAFER